MVLLNLRSLSKHLTEIVNDHRLIQNDIVFSFESQINPQEHIESKANHFEQVTIFFFFFDNNENKFSLFIYHWNIEKTGKILQYFLKQLLKRFILFGTYNFDAIIYANHKQIFENDYITLLWPSH